MHEFFIGAAFGRIEMVGNEMRLWNTSISEIGTDYVKSRRPLQDDEGNDVIGSDGRGVWDEQVHRIDDSGEAEGLVPLDSEVARTVYLLGDRYVVAVRDAETGELDLYHDGKPLVIIPDMSDYGSSRRIGESPRR